jgi:hypothetical protein
MITITSAREKAMTWWKNLSSVEKEFLIFNYSNGKGNELTKNWTGVEIEALWDFDRNLMMD